MWVLYKWLHFQRPTNKMGQIFLQDGIGERGAQEQRKNMEENVEYSYEVPQYISEMKFDVGQFP